MVWNLLIIREIFKGDHNAAAVSKMRRKQISALSGTLNKRGFQGTLNNLPYLSIAMPLPINCPLYLCKFHISGFYIILKSQHFCDSGIPKKDAFQYFPNRITLTRNKENQNKTWQFWWQMHWNLQNYEMKLYNFSRFKVCLACWQARSRL